MKAEPMRNPERSKATRDDQPPDHTVNSSPLTECDKCRNEVPVDETHTCEKCGVTLCSQCVCEKCVGAEG